MVPIIIYVDHINIILCILVGRGRTMQDIAEILATNGLWSAELRWGFGNLDPQVSFS